MATNADRAMWSIPALEAFQAETGTDTEDAVSDLLGDLMHLCHQDAAKWGEFEAELERARKYYAHELANPFEG